ncbi:MAG: IS66 family transposase [Shewanella sp.]|nr:IS66 family transposase [Shewanella sp.]MCF1432225.1 IS66 family transposase [Shewanella sp.]MCF1439980.1 IS66 family transposase [Shewanella sp.]MCF1457261.1 IS66 family transposase [Shewanella sp.]
MTKPVAQQCPVNFLDGYATYEQTHATLVGCWAHARRKFVDARKDQPKGKSSKVDIALSHIQKLYAIESSLKGKLANEKYTQRQQQAKPQLDSFRDWLEKSALNTPPKSVLGQAIHYSLNQWDKLVR